MDNPPPPHRIELIGINVPFWELVTLLVKIALAAIPAAVILGVLGMFIFVIGGALLE